MNKLNYIEETEWEELDSDPTFTNKVLKDIVSKLNEVIEALNKEK